MITASKSEAPLCVPSGLLMLSSLGWKYTFHALSLLHVQQPWISHAYSHAIINREAAHKNKWCLSLATPGNRALYISVWYCVEATPRILSLAANVKMLPTLIFFLEIYGIVPKLSPRI